MSPYIPQWMPTAAANLLGNSGFTVKPKSTIYETGRSDMIRQQCVS